MALEKSKRFRNFARIVGCCWCHLIRFIWFDSFHSITPFQMWIVGDRCLIDTLQNTRNFEVLSSSDIELSCMFSDWFVVNIAIQLLLSKSPEYLIGVFFAEKQEQKRNYNRFAEMRWRTRALRMWIKSTEAAADCRCNSSVSTALEINNFDDDCLFPSAWNSRSTNSIWFHFTLSIIQIKANPIPCNHSERSSNAQNQKRFTDMCMSVIGVCVFAFFIVLHSFVSLSSFVRLFTHSLNQLNWIRFHYIFIDENLEIK